jgi:ribosomal protein S18 acetylase RimI-like enzyme
MEKAEPALDIETMRANAEAPELADRAGVRAAAADLADAFVADPLFVWLSRTDARRDAGRLSFFSHLLMELAFGVGEVRRPAGGGAAAVWMPSEALGANPLHKELAALPALLALTGFSRFSRMIALREELDRHHPRDRAHDYLFFLGVARHAQGRGIGSRLLKARTEDLDARARPAYLETATEANVRLYSRFGFEVRAEFRPGRDGPLNWAMWREPRAS